ncbi:MAG: hypothetical protein L7U87_08690 [Chlamydiales bacterium]|nr:hypothetical protein [Chlamydiales bacterium]
MSGQIRIQAGSSRLTRGVSLSRPREAGSTSARSRTASVASSRLRHVASSRAATVRTASSILANSNSKLLNALKDLSKRKESGHVIDSRTNTHYYVSVDRSSKLTVDIRGRVIPYRMLNYLVQNLPSTKLKKFMFKGENLLQIRGCDIRDAFSRISRLSPLDRTRNTDKSSFTFYDFKSKSCIKITKIKKENGRDVIDVTTCAKVKDSHLRDILQRLNASSSQVRYFKTAPSLTGRSQTKISSKVGEEGKLSLSIHAKTFAELKSYVPILYGPYSEIKVFCSELGCASRAQANLVITKQSAESRLAEIKVNNGQVIPAALSQFLELFETATTFKITKVKAETLSSQAKYSDKFSFKIGDPRLDTRDKRKIDEKIARGLFRENTYFHYLLEQLALNEPRVFKELMRLNGKAFLIRCYSYAKLCFLGNFSYSKNSFFKAKIDLIFDRVTYALERAETLETAFLRVSHEGLMDLICRSTAGAEMDFDSICTCFGIDKASFAMLERRARLGGDLKEARYRGIVKSHADPLIAEDRLSELNLSRALNPPNQNRDNPGMGSLSFENTCSSKQDLIELKFARMIKEFRGEINIRDPLLKGRLSKALAFYLLAYAKKSETSCTGEFDISYNHSIKSSYQERAAAGKACALAAELSTLSINGQHFNTSHSGLFKGGDFIIDEFKALTAAKNSLGLTAQQVPGVEEKEQLDAILQSIISGNSLENESLESNLDDLSKIIEESYFSSFEYSLKNDRDPYGRHMNDITIYHAKRSSSNSVDNFLEHQALDALNRIKLSYPSIVRPKDYRRFIEGDISDVAEFYGLEGLEQSSVPMLSLERGSYCRRMVHKTIKNHVAFNLLQRCRISSSIDERYGSDPLVRNRRVFIADKVMADLLEVKDSKGKKTLQANPLSANRQMPSTINVSLIEAKEKFASLSDRELGVVESYLNYHLELMEKHLSEDLEFEASSAMYIALTTKEKERVTSFLASFNRLRLLLECKPLFSLSQDEASLSRLVCSQDNSSLDAAEGNEALQLFLAERQLAIRARAVAAEVPEEEAAEDTRLQEIDISYFPRGRLRDSLREFEATAGEEKAFVDFYPVDVEKNLRGLLHESNLRGFNSVTDNDCLYVSIVQALIGIQNSASSKIKDRALGSVEHTEQMVKELRKAVSNYIMRNKERFLYLVSTREDEAYSWACVNERERRNRSLTGRTRKESALRRKCRAIESGEWVSEVELQVLSEILGRQLHVYEGENSFSSSDLSDLDIRGRLGVDGFWRVDKDPQLYSGLVGRHHKPFAKEPLRLLFKDGHYNWLAHSGYADDIYEKGYDRRRGYQA